MTKQPVPEDLEKELAQAQADEKVNCEKSPYASPDEEAFHQAKTERLVYIAKRIQSVHVYREALKTILGISRFDYTGIHGDRFFQTYLSVGAQEIVDLPGSVDRWLAFAYVDTERVLDRIAAIRLEIENAQYQEGVSANDDAYDDTYDDTYDDELLF